MDRVALGGVSTILDLSKAGTASLTVPANRIYYIDWMILYYQTDATVATRKILPYIQTPTRSTKYYWGVKDLTATNGIRLGFNAPGPGQNVDAAANPVHTIGAAFAAYPGCIIGLEVTNEAANDFWYIEGHYRAVVRN